jgi:hypothetical protein
MSTPPALDRARERHLLAHPEEATPDDVRQLVRSLNAMRRACFEAAEVGAGGTAIVVTMEPAAGHGMHLGLTAPTLTDEQVVSLTAELIRDLLAGVEP